MSEHPLGLSKGSVRSILALVMIGLFSLLSVYAVVVQHPLARDILMLFAPMSAGAAGYYFGSRTATPPETS